MTLDEAIIHAEEEAKEQDKLCKRYDDASGYTRSHNEDIRTTNAKKCAECAADHRQLAEWLKDYKRLLEKQPCEDCISRRAVDTLVDELARAISDERCCISRGRSTATIMRDICLLPSVTPQQKTGHCRECKYFEYDSVAKVNGIPLIVAHEICSKWGDGCKTKEDGYCFLFDPQERSDKD